MCHPYFLILHNAGRWCREGDNKGVEKKRTSGITNASDKAHHVQDTGVKGHGSFAIIVSRSSNSPPLSVSFSWMPSVPGLLLLLLLSSTGFRPYTRAGTTKGTARRRERRRQMTRGSCSLDRSHVTSCETPWTRFILSSLSESLSNIPSLYPPSAPSFSRRPSLNLSHDECSRFTLPPRFLSTCSPKSRALVSPFSFPCSAGAMSNTRINHAQTFPRSGHARR